MNIFITGQPKSGKTTVLMKIVEILKQRGLKIGGIVTPEIRKEGSRIGFSVKDVYSGKEGILASVRLKSGPRLGKYRVAVEDFERISLSALDSAVKECDVIIIDEIGTMELFSENFKEKLIEILSTNKKIVATLHRSYVDEYRKFGRMLEVTEKNRDLLPEEIIKLIS